MTILRMARLRVGAAAALISAPLPLAGQDVAADLAPGAPVLPDWSTAWSPLEQARGIRWDAASAPGRLDLLAWPAPRVGLLWSAGVAAALPFEVQEISSRFHASAAQVAGEYRRPLDPPEAQVGRVLGIGWRPLGERGAVVGKVDVGREWLRPASVALGLESYGGTPFLPTDTAHPDVARTRVTLEGAGGYRLGDRWAGGIALGYAALDSRTDRTPLPRRGRAASSSAALSVVRSIPSAGIAVAGYVRRSRWTEQASVTEQAARDLVFELQGFSEPEPVSFSVGYSRRMQRDEHGYGVGMAGHALGTAWSAFGELRDSDEGHSSQFSNDPPTDRWTVSGYALGAAAARSVGERVAITARADLEQGTGRAERHDLTGAVFRSEERVLDGAVGLRLLPSGGWAAGLAFTFTRQERLRRDLVAELTADLQAWNTGGTVEIARVVSSRLALSASYGAALYGPTAALPRPEEPGEVFSRIIAPELAMAAQRGVAQQAGVNLRWQSGRGSPVSIDVRHARFAPNGVLVPSAPSGERSMWTIGVGVVLDGTRAPPPSP